MDSQWHDLLLQATQRGEPRNDRTGVGTRALFGVQCRFDLREGFPACTTKRLGFGQVKAELAAFIRGAESLEEFNLMGCSIWDANASAPAWKERQRFPLDVGRIYGVQWRRWRSWRAAHWVDQGAHRGTPHHDDVQVAHTDQLADLVAGLRADPHGRRHLVTTWQPGELDAMCLPPCHVGFQCFASDEVTDPARPRGSLDLGFRMRSLDLFIGMPFDVASYALLCHLIARDTGRAPRWLVMDAGDAHVYNNHRAQVETVLGRMPFSPPRLRLQACEGSPSPLFGFLPDDADLEMYSHHPAVPAPMNV